MTDMLTNRTQEKNYPVEARVLALWGSPQSGTTTTAVKMALTLAQKKKNVLILLCDQLTPAPQTLLPNTSTEGKSLGELLTLPAISQESILQRCILLSKSPHICLLGYMRGDNAFTYAAYSRERVVDLLTLARHFADYVLIDTSSMFSNDLFSAVVLECADAVVRLGTCDLKSISYFSANLPLLADGRFSSSQHIRVLSIVKPGQDSGEYTNTFGGVSYTLPYVPELEEQFYSAQLTEKLCTVAAKKYSNTVKQMVADIFGDKSEDRTPATKHVEPERIELPERLRIKPPRDMDIKEDDESRGRFQYDMNSEDDAEPIKGFSSVVNGKGDASINQQHVKPHRKSRFFFGFSPTKRETKGKMNTGNSLFERLKKEGGSS